MNDRRTLLVCCGTGCLASGAKEVVTSLEKAIQVAGSDVDVQPLIKKTGCNGFCERGPIVKVHPDDISYYRVKPAHATKIIESLGKTPVESLLFKTDAGQRVTRQEDNPFYAPQKKIALRNIGEIDPESLEDYCERGGYQALKKAATMEPSAIIEEVTASGLRGRGGAGFSTGKKWFFAAGYDEFPKYVVCNGDEGDPGAFMDRSILEGDPHGVIEGLAIAALAVGAEQGFFYIRDEYSLALHNVAIALEMARQQGYLGHNFAGSGRDFDIEIVRGGGAFVCGESTALMASIEGRIGEPRAKYIRSVQKGLWNKPTVLNNVETLVNIPSIILNGADSFASLGTQASTGTKVFSLVGKVQRTGLVEIPMGVTLHHLIYDIGGGIKNGRPFKAVQTGGPSGGCIPESLLSLEVDFDSLAHKGAMMGSGGLIVMDDTSCMVEVARYYTEFLSGESCGKCTACREGLRQMDHILTAITKGQGQPGDIELLEDICFFMEDTSLCALGKTASNPVLSTIKYFRDEYEAHIKDHHCEAGVCPELTTFFIDEDTCTGCGLCMKACPTKAILGEKKEVHSITQELCISCGSCRTACRFDAVRVKK